MASGCFRTRKKGYILLYLSIRRTNTNIYDSRLPPLNTFNHCMINNNYFICYKSNALIFLYEKLRMNESQVNKKNKLQTSFKSYKSKQTFTTKLEFTRNVQS